MKKLLSLALALVMILSLSTTAFADTEIAVNPTGAGNKNVTGKYVAGAESGIIYKIDISWGSMAFTYTDASKGTWQPDSHTYTGAKDAAWSWEDGDNKITVTNHSNDGITVTPSYTADTGFENASMTFDKTSLTLETADNGENGAAGTATNGTITVTPGGSVPAGTSGKIGQITLSIAGTDGSSAGGETTDDKAVITGVEVKVGDTTYQSGDTVALTSEGVVTLIVKGTNLQNVNANTNLLFFAPNAALPVTSEDWEINTNGTEATTIINYGASILATMTTAYEILYTNDGGTTRTGSGVKILYGESSGDITGGTTVSTPEDLANALSDGGVIKLTNDITIPTTFISNTAMLDLNNCTLTVDGNGIYVYSGASLTIKNGTVVNEKDMAVVNYGGNVNVESCILTGRSMAFYHSLGTSALKNCTLNGLVRLDGNGTITLSGNISFSSGVSSVSGEKGISVDSEADGSVICYFDPTNNIYDGIVTNNGDGTWTVTKDS